MQLPAAENLLGWCAFGFLSDDAAVSLSDGLVRMVEEQLELSCPPVELNQPKPAAAKLSVVWVDAGRHSADALGRMLLARPLAADNGQRRDSGCAVQ